MGATPRMQSSSHLWTEEGESSHGLVARVALIHPFEPVAGGYRYAVPNGMEAELRPGQRVQVPFGKKDRPIVGFCVAVSQEEWTGTLKRIDAVIDPVPLIDEKLLALAEWAAGYYACSLGGTLATMVPDAVRRGMGMKVVREVALAKPLERILNPTAGTTEDSLHATAQQRIGPKHLALLEHLVHAGDPVPVAAALATVGCTAAVIRVAEARGHVRVTTRREPAPGPNFDRPGEEPAFALNKHQSAAVERLSAIIDADAFRVALLFGVSGSGKTEVYIHAMRKVLDAGRQVILLVPEIALTTQTAHRLAARFSDVAVIHSGLTGASRARTWSDIALGRKKVIIGTRSAVFAPCPHLGLIVVDEEQEPSYKSPRTPRYHTRDIAVMRGHQAGFPVILGSATPSLETWHNCQRLSHYECIRLPERATGNPLPTVELIDMRVEHRARRGMHLLSRRMEEELRAAHERREQSMLLLNRRGYATYVFCPSCQEPITCPQCSANMVFHKSAGPHKATEQCICHYCHTRVAVPDKCPDATCGHTLVRFGMGTQRVEEELGVKMPGLRVARVDADTMNRPADYEAVVADFEARKLDALVGTQMIAKGLDFPFVSFVGVVSADTALAIPDFRAAERTFQLVVQVAGRSGRAETAGIVIVQSFAPQAAALRAAVAHDYESFAAEELEHRRRERLPPFSRLARIVLAHEHESKAREEAVALGGRVREALEAWASPADCLGPQACPLARIRNRYRFDLLVRAPGARALQDTLTRLRAEKILTAKGKPLTIDVDPVSLL